MIIKLKDHPEVARIVRAVDPGYRKHDAIVQAVETLALSGTAWNGGSRSTYTAVDLTTMRASTAPQYAPACFGGPLTAPQVAVPSGVAVVRTGVFCGKTATATVYLNPANLTPLLGPLATG